MKKIRCIMMLNYKSATHNYYRGTAQQEMLCGIAARLSKILFLLFPCIIFLQALVFAQPSLYPKGYFRNPLNVPMQLVSNFGALRDDHFHMGLDLRTGGKENLPVHAAAGGYVSRVKIEKYGYGNAIYISHGNGYTTLYAHLNTFYTALADYIKKIQYENESWAQDMELPAGMFVVSKGQLIGLSGNTGGSAGPHLHFEIRDTKTGTNINPGFFGFAVADKIAPEIKGLYWYNRQYSTYAIAANAVAIKKTTAGYTSNSKTVIVNSPRISFGIESTDLTNGSPFHLGIYSAALYLDDALLFEFELNRFSYEDTRYINGSIDYSKKSTGKKWIQHLSVLPGNKLDIFSETGSDGVIALTDTLPHKIRIETADIYNNKSALYFTVKYSGKSLAATIPEFRQLMIPSQENSLESKYAQFYFPSTAFYDSVPFRFYEFISNEKNSASKVFVLHSEQVPVHDAFVATVQTNLDSASELLTHVVMRLQSGSSTTITKGEWMGSSMSAKFRKLGTLQLIVDTVPPVITPVGFKNDAAIKTNKITFRCTDDLKEIASFRAELDGNWILFAALKNDLYSYTFDEHCGKGQHTLTIKITDLAGNAAVQNFTFTR